MNLRQKYENYIMNSKPGEAYTFEGWKRLQNSSSLSPFKRKMRKKNQDPEGEILRQQNHFQPRSKTMDLK